MTVRAQSFGNGADVTMNLDIPEPGCWQITGMAGSHTLQFVVNVLPQRARPDVQDLIQRHQGFAPFAPPLTCAVTAVVGPAAHVTERSPYAQFEYSLEGNGLSLRGAPDLLFEGENALAWFPNEWADISIRGNLIGDAGLTLRSTGIRTADERGEYWRSTVLFPAPGCWELHAAWERKRSTPSCMSTRLSVIVTARGSCRPPARRRNHRQWPGRASAGVAARLD